MNAAAVPYELGLLDDLGDREEAMAYLKAALEDGDQEVIQLALQHVIEAQEAGNDAIGVADMDDEQFQLSARDQFWTLISERRKQQTISRAELGRRLDEVAAQGTSLSAHAGRNARTGSRRRVRIARFP